MKYNFLNYQVFLSSLQYCPLGKYKNCLALIPGLTVGGGQSKKAVCILQALCEMRGSGSGQ